MQSVDIAQITGTARSVTQLLANTRYGLDFYQREYSWGEAQVIELLDDLTIRFLEQFDPSHSRSDVAMYRPYFLGPIVTSHRDGISYLVDGQQRITTLSLLLIHLRHLHSRDEAGDATALDGLIYSTSYGKKSFNIDVAERDKCMTAILGEDPFNPEGEPDSVQNLWDRFDTIVSHFSEDLEGASLPFFTDWLLNRVILVDIGAPDRDMALEIFETMNDRGLRLNSTDMLKSYLLARVGDEETIRDLNERWRRSIAELGELDKNADVEFVKSWLRADFAETQRERKASASPGDFELIGTAAHKWVRDNTTRLGLDKTGDFRQFVEDRFLGMSGRYIELLHAADTLTPGMEAVFYNAHMRLTLQLPAILAALEYDDNNEVFATKANLVATALDIFVVRRMVNFRRFGYSTVQYTMFNLMKSLRGASVDELRKVLTEWLADETERLDGIDNFRLTGQNRVHVHFLLARMTAWLDEKLGNGSTFDKYVRRTGGQPYEVEHIWANHFDRHSDEFDSKHDFEEYRDRFGDLLLLPKAFNASYGDMVYAEKHDHYNAQNPLARSLHPMAYENNPGFRRLIEETGLGFKPHPGNFTKADIDARQSLYRSLAEIIWDPATLQSIG